MPRYFIKPDLAVDQYVWWSTIVDGPLMWGTRKQFLKKYKKKKYMFDFGQNFLERLDRADATGSSSYFSPGGEEIQIGGIGTLPWEAIPAFLKIYETDLSMEMDDPRLIWLVDKFDWDDDDE